AAPGESPPRRTIPAEARPATPATGWSGAALGIGGPGDRLPRCRAERSGSALPHRRDGLGVVARLHPAHVGADRREVGQYLARAGRADDLELEAVRESGAGVVPEPEAADSLVGLRVVRRDGVVAIEEETGIRHLVGALDLPGRRPGGLRRVVQG